MGNGSSVPVEGTEGYHVLRVQDNSPGQVAGLEPFFDFIISIGSKRLDTDDESFKEILKQHVDKPLELTVYNSKSQTVRQTQIIPSTNWGGQGILGVSIRFCSFEGANQNVWHIISVQPNSPASQAGLIGDSDYVLGAESVLQQADDLISLVQANIGKPVKLYVYNVDCDNVREVSLVPNDAWGGDGCLGCDIGYGYLHRIPTSVDRSHPIENVVVNTSVPQTQSSTVASNVAQPGFTGIPQIDSISQLSNASNAPPKSFPDPSEFLVNLSQPSNQNLPPTVSTPQPAFSQPNEHHHGSQSYNAPVQSFVSENQNQPQNGVKSEPNVQSFDLNTYMPSVNGSNVPPPSSTFAPQQNFYQPSVQQQSFSMPPQQHNEQSFQNLPPQVPVSSFAPPTKFKQEPSDQHQQLTNQFSSGSTGPPINSSTYQPYLAYGAPPSSMPPTNIQQFSPPASAQPPTAFSMPSYSLPNTFIPQPPVNTSVSSTNWSTPGSMPPPIFNNLPMPSLQDLGIKDLVQPPISNANMQYGQPPIPQNLPNY